MITIEISIRIRALIRENSIIYILALIAALLVFIKINRYTNCKQNRKHCDCKAVGRASNRIAAVIFIYCPK